MVEVFKGTPIRRMTTGGNYVNLTADVVLLSDYEALRAELEQVKRDNADLKDLLDDARSGTAKLLADRIRSEAAERLAGARVKMPSGELCRYIEQCREISNGGEYPWWSRLAEILSALAEPAGEAEPRQFLPTEDGEFNGDAEETPIAAEDGREVDWVDVTGWGVFKGHAIPVDVARYIATKINLYAEHRTTHPDASAIREALERGQALANQVRSVTCHLNGQAYSSTVSALNYFDAALSRAALAGAKP